MKYLFLLMLACSSQAICAEKQTDFNPADPSIWQEKPQSAAVRTKEQQGALCKGAPNASCPTAGDNLTDIQREQQRRESKQQYNELEKSLKK